MSANADSAHARQYKRHDVRLDARIDPHPDHAEQFRLAFPDAKTGLVVTDISQGGMGLTVGIFLPKNMRLTVHVAASATTGKRPLTVRVVVSRCVMLDHKPTYHLGLQFVDPKGEDEQVLIQGVTKQQTEEKQLAGVGAGVS